MKKTQTTPATAFTIPIGDFHQLEQQQSIRNYLSVEQTLNIDYDEDDASIVENYSNTTTTTHHHGALENVAHLKPPTEDHLAAATWCTMKGLESVAPSTTPPPPTTTTTTSRLPEVNPRNRRHRKQR